MLLLVGLGNPGPGYANNRHNVGFMAVDEIVRRHDFGAWRRRFQSDLSEGRIGDAKVLAQKPLAYMNRSGLPVAAALKYYKLQVEAVIVIHDELDLVPGKLRVKTGGGAGGHNGLRDLDRHIGQDYRRVRIGIGHPGDKDLVEGYVLHDVPKADLPDIETVIEAVAEAFPLLAEGADDAFMSKVALRVNPPKPKPEPDSGQPQPRPATGNGGADPRGERKPASGLKAALDVALGRGRKKRDGNGG